MQISDRLKLVVSFVEPCKSVADIGTDHGYVPIALVKQNTVNRAYAMDINAGPLERAEMHIREEGLEEKIEVRQSDGLENLKENEAETVIISTGASAKYLGLADEKKYAGMGVSACATCDGFFYRKKTVAVVGGGDTACEEASYLSNLASKVYMIVRKDHLRASKVMQQRVMEKDNIEILFNTNTVGLFGSPAVEGAHLVQFKGTPEEKTLDIDIDGFFLAIGHKPNTDFLGGQIELDELGYVKTDGFTTATNVPGVFAAGDVADPRYRQAITAAGMGCKAALDVEKFLVDNGIK